MKRIFGVATIGGGHVISGIFQAIILIVFDKRIIQQRQ